MKFKNYLTEISAKVRKWNYSDFQKALEKVESNKDKKLLKRIANDVDATTNLKEEEKSLLQSMIYRISTSI